MRQLTECPVCGSVALHPFASLSGPRNGALHSAQVRCAGCRLVISQPQAADSDIREYYRHRYYEEQWPDARAMWIVNAARHRRVTMPLLEKLWQGWVRDGGFALEIGCGYGAMLDALEESGYRAVGVDPSVHALTVCRSHGLRVIVGTAPEVPVRDGRFDLAVARHVIEHVVDPAGFVSSLARFVRPGGVIALETENVWTSQYFWDRCRAAIVGRAAPFRTSTDHTFVFQSDHLRQFLVAAGCSDVRIKVFSERPDAESLHWRIYKGLFRSLDRIAGVGEYVLAVGRKSLA